MADNQTTWSRGRVALMLAAFTAAIAGAVIATDILSARDRTRALREPPKSQPATTTAPTTTTAPATQP